MHQGHEDLIRRKLAATQRARAAKYFVEYAGRPSEFSSEVMGLTEWSRSREMLESIRDNDRTLIAAGHKVSKTASLVASAVWWCVAEHPTRDTRVILTAPSAHQVKNVLWDEFVKRMEWIEENHPALRRKLGPKEIPKDPSTGYRFHSGAQIIGVSTNEPERVAGLSGSWLLIIVDEASGYRDDLFNALRGNEAGGAKLVAASNPTKPLGWFYDGTTNGEWNFIQISSLESPNVIARERLIPGLATHKWAERLAREFGPNPEEHPEYQVRVLGVFPSRTEDQIISLASLKIAQATWTSMEPEKGRLIIGVDPARYGVDECVIWAVRGNHAYHPIILGGATDGKDIADAVIKEARARRRLPRDLHVPIVVDGVSSGAAVVDMLRYSKAAKRGEISVIVHEGFRVAKNEARFANKRTEVWFELARWLKKGGKVPTDREFEREALAALYSFDHKTRLVIQDKDRMKKALGRSPNRADALTLAVSTTPPSVGNYETAQDLAVATGDGWDDDYEDDDDDDDW